MIYLWWVWMAAAVLLLVLEVLAPGFIFLGFAIGAAVVGLWLLAGYAIAWVWLLLIFAVVSLAMVGMGMDLLSAMSATIACLSSVGPGLADVGPTQNFGFVPGGGKLLLSFCMIAGRLEIFALFAVFSPECWRR